MLRLGTGGFFLSSLLFSLWDSPDRTLFMSSFHGSVFVVRLAVPTQKSNVGRTSGTLLLMTKLGGGNRIMLLFRLHHPPNPTQNASIPLSILIKKSHTRMDALFCMKNCVSHGRVTSAGDQVYCCYSCTYLLIFLVFLLRI